MARPKREHIHSIDQSWQRYVPCDWCGKPMCVNNYADRRSRIARYKGRVICAWCRKIPSIRQMAEIVHELSLKPCEKKNKKKCKCLPCQARRFFSGPEAKA